jgi:hypothetical protein
MIPTFNLRPIRDMDPADPTHQPRIQPLIDLMLLHYPGARRMSRRALKRLVTRTFEAYRSYGRSTNIVAETRLLQTLPAKVIASAHRAGHIILT